MSTFKKRIVLIKYPCYICEGNNFFYTAGQLLRHLSNVHQVDYPSRPQGQKRPYDMKYSYAKDQNQPFDSVLLGCPSCQHSTEELKDLEQHMKDSHEVFKTSKMPYKQYVYRGDYYDREASNGVINKIYDLADKFKDHFVSTMGISSEKRTNK